MVTDKQMAQIERLLKFVPEEFKEDVKHDLVLLKVINPTCNVRSLRRERDNRLYAYTKHGRKEVRFDSAGTVLDEHERDFILSHLYQKTSGLSKQDLRILLTIVEAVMADNRWPLKHAAITLCISRWSVSRTVKRLVQNKIERRLSEITGIWHLRRLLMKRIRRK